MINLRKGNIGNIAIKEQAIKLRLEQRLFATTIAEQLGVRPQTCQNWLRPFPLTVEEMRAIPRPVKKSLVGKKFGRLLVEERIHDYQTGKHPRVLYKCKCDCGATVTKPYVNLKTGDTRSCGCLKRETLSLLKRGDDTLVRLHTMGRYYRRNAKLAGREWKIDDAAFLQLASSPCEYCGFNEGLVGLDRVDSLGNYIIENVVSCCESCNRAKSDLTLSQFKEWVRRAYLHMNLGIAPQSFERYAPSDKEFMERQRARRLVTDRTRRNLKKL